MSQTAAVRTARVPRPAARHQGRPATAPRSSQPPRLRVVSAPRHTRSRAGLVAASVALLALGLVGLLLLDVSLERGTYELRDQNVRAEQLREQEQRLQQDIQDRTAPQNLAAEARKLGMVDAAGAPVFVLPNGRTVGVPRRAALPPSPTVTAKSAGRTPTAAALPAKPARPTAKPTNGTAKPQQPARPTTRTATGSPKTAAKPTSRR